jgi:Kef-type K+ transport system membrane component KefB/uncharacterized UPF0146 family protein
MNNVFIELAIVLGIVSVLGFLVQKIKLPLVVAYLLTGVFLSFFLQAQSTSQFGIFTFLPDLGIAFVLFLIGMELDLRELKALGQPIIASSLGQIVIAALVGYAVASLFGFTQSQAFLLGAGLSFSSTVVIVKMLLEKKDLASLYGKLSVGILLIEDLVAIGILMVISVGESSFHLGLQTSMPVLAIILKAGLLFVLTYILSRFVLEKIFDAVAKSSELLFFTAITWCFLFTALAQIINFSVTIGAFLAGIALASSPYHYQIQGKIKPLRDFFVTLFFVYLGTQVKLGDLYLVWPLIIIFTLYAILVKPVIFLLILGAFGFRKHTIFQVALNLTQISEFSLVILLLGVRMNILPSTLLSLMAAVAVLTIMFSSVLISYSNTLYRKLLPFVGFFERKEMVHDIEKKLEEELDDHVIVIGAHRVGGPIVEYLEHSKIPFAVIDFNPHVVEKLRKKGINIIYGDISDPEILDNLQIEKAKLIISTATELADNEALLVDVNRRKIRAKVVARALDEEQSKKLKNLGAEYVILPEKVSGDFLATQLKASWPEVKFSGLS